MTTTIAFGSGPDLPVFLENLDWESPLGSTTARPLTSRYRTFHADAERLGGNATMLILTKTFSEALTLADKWGTNQRAILKDPTLGILLRHRVEDPITINSVRVGDKIVRWRLTVKAVQQQ